MIDRAGRIWNLLCSGKPAEKLKYALREDRLPESWYNLVAARPSACPRLTRGRFAYDIGDTAGLTPLVKMYALGAIFVPPGFHAGGLRYHGMAPVVGRALRFGLIEAVSVQLKVFAAGSPVRTGRV